jgi:uncharacterized protein YcfJ
MDIRKNTIGALVALSLMPVAALADDPPNRGAYDYARVTQVEPLYRTVRTSEPRETCWNEEVVNHDQRRDAAPRGRAGRTIVGGLLGGLVGAQLGDGRGRDAATVAGALIGSAIANDNARRDDYYRDQARGDDRYTEVVQRCSVTNDYYEEEILDGYRVSYEYGGETYTTRMAQEPGRTIRVWVSVRPANG